MLPYFLEQKFDKELFVVDPNEAFFQSLHLKTDIVSGIIIGFICCLGNLGTA